MQERENTTELFIMSQYSWWEQCISFRKRLESTAPFLIHPLYTHQSPECIGEPHKHIFPFGYMYEVLMMGIWTGLLYESPNPNPDTFS